MGISNIAVLFPRDGFPQDLPLGFVVEPAGDGIYTITGPDNMVRMTDATHFFLDSPSVTDLGDGIFTASSD